MTSLPKELQHRTASHMSPALRDLLRATLSPRRYDITITTFDVGYESSKADLKDHIEKLIGEAL